MTRASSALALHSEKGGVLFHGMPGVGKTSCAIELAYHHKAAARFRAFVWFQLEQGKDIALALRDFALAMEKQLPGFEMVHVIDHDDAWKNWLPRFAEFLRGAAVLIVLDNLESLLTESGYWRDERWGLLMDTLFTPGGLSRTVLTSRTYPATLPSSTEVIAVDALSRDEALLLVRELPNMSRLLDGGGELPLAQGRELVRRTLRLVQGHPKLIELAEAQAAVAGNLAKCLEQADEARGKGEGELDAFFREGESTLGPSEFLSQIQGWTVRIAGALPAAAQTFFHFACDLEEGDRETQILEANWAEFWQRLGHPQPAPNLEQCLGPLVAAALVERQPLASLPAAYIVRIHSGVAEVGRAEAGASFQDAVDRQLAAMWSAFMCLSLDAHGKEPAAGSLIARAGIAAFPYLSRLGEWARASDLLERVIVLDKSPATVAAVLPLAERIVKETAGTNRTDIEQGRLARVLAAAGRKEEAGHHLRAVIRQAVEGENFALASSLSGVLIGVLLDTGQPEAALDTVEQKATFSRRAGFGPWSLLVDEGQRLTILNELGRQREVLPRSLELREQMRTLPDPPGPNDASINIWNARESTLGLGREAAQRLGEWQHALDLNVEIVESMKQRGATPREIARREFNDYGPLLHLNRPCEAWKLLVRCRVVFEQANSVVDLGRVLAGLASMEMDPGKALKLQATALRYLYTDPDPLAIAVSHSNLATTFMRAGREWREVVAHRLAAVLIFMITKLGDTTNSIAALAADLRNAGNSAMPSDYESLCRTVEQVEGVRFKDLFQRLATDRTSGDCFLERAINAALGA